METRTMPETITAMRSITYETDQVVSYVAEAYEKPSDEVTYEEVVEWVKENAYEDFTEQRSYGFSLSYIDENGESV